MAFLSQSFLATMVYVMEITSKGRMYNRTKVVKSKYFQKRSAGGGKLGRQTIRIVLFLKIKDGKNCQLHYQMHTTSGGQTLQMFLQISVKAQIAELTQYCGQVPLSMENFALGLTFGPSEDPQEKKVMIHIDIHVL